jgi:hypothetical protein
MTTYIPTNAFSRGSSLLDGMGLGGHGTASRPMKRRNGDNLFFAGVLGRRGITASPHDPPPTMRLIVSRETPHFSHSSYDFLG